MRKLKWLVVLILLLLVVQPCLADDREKLLGIWKLVSWEKETVATGQRNVFFGKSPTGYMIFTPEGRMMVTHYGRREAWAEHQSALR